MNTQREDPHEKRARRARADLERLQAQSEKFMGAPPAGPDEVDESDWIELWGRRIGLGLGVLALIWVVHNLLTTYIFVD